MNNNCRICNSSNLKTFVKGNTELIECRECGIVFNQKMPSKEDLNDYYTKEYQLRSNLTGEIYSEYRRFSQAPEQIKLIAEIKQYLNEGDSILDIGCYKGAFIDEARRWGFKVTGVEPSAEGREYLSTLGLNAFSQLEEVNEKFSGIVMWHSLEHITEPLEYLKRLKSYLKDGGYLFIRVPAYDSVWSKLLGKNWVWFQPHNHYFHYSTNSMKKLIYNAEYQLISLIKQYPNNRLTKQSQKAFRDTFRVTFNLNIGFRKRIGEFFESITGMEIFAILKKN